jgi:hypothetical protein
VPEYLLAASPRRPTPAAPCTWCPPLAETPHPRPARPARLASPVLTAAVTACRQVRTPVTDHAMLLLTIASPKGSPAGAAVPVTARQPGGRRDVQAKGIFMTAAPCNRSADADRDGTGRLRELRRELDLWGIVIGDVAAGRPASVGRLPGARCEVSLQDPGTLALAYHPQGRDLRAHEIIWLALALLDGDGPPEPGADVVPDRRLPLEDAVVRVLASRGMAAEPAQAGHRDEATAALLVSNPADQSRGRLTVSGGRELTWECRFADPDSPDPGLSPSGIARAIAAALAGAGGEPR